jgi:aminoglycoside phosphotransferase family enzyme/predicted kinase
MASPDPQEAVIGFLADPRSHGTQSAVERIDTHASILFLVGDTAYKLKRAIAFSYLDYTTLERREWACRRELLLNRRTAPEIYLEVRAIRSGADGRPAFDGGGPVLDWVLVMRRFAQECLFDRLAAAGRLTPALMRDLADCIVDFHRAAERADSYGDGAGWRELIEGNRRNLLQRPCLDAAAVARLTERSLAWLERVAASLETRRRRGKVRRCHGDLHLGNICLLAGKPTLFDAIEFSDRIACIDQLYDLAFLLMDLEHRRLGRLASLVFNRTLDREDELDGLVALPLFLSLRAAIRAHVALARTGGAADATARGYFARAEGLLDAARPRLIAVGGLSGSGKSVLAASLAAELGPAPGARVIRSDVLRKRLLGAEPETRLGADAYSAEMSVRVYRAMRDEAESVLASGYPAILDATFMDLVERDAAADVARRMQLPFDGLWLAAPPAVLAARVAARTGDASDADLAVLESQLAAAAAAPEWQRIDAAGEPEASLAAARRLIFR